VAHGQRAIVDRHATISAIVGPGLKATVGHALQAALVTGLRVQQAPVDLVTAAHARPVASAIVAPVLMVIVDHGPEAMVIGRPVRRVPLAALAIAGRALQVASVIGAPGLPAPVAPAPHALGLAVRRLHQPNR
jgi:hypothetical protein